MDGEMNGVDEFFKKIPETQKPFIVSLNEHSPERRSFVSTGSANSAMQSRCLLHQHGHRPLRTKGINPTKTNTT